MNFTTNFTRRIQSIWYPLRGKWIKQLKRFIILYIFRIYGLTTKEIINIFRNFTTELPSQPPQLDPIWLKANSLSDVSKEFDKQNFSKFQNIMEVSSFIQMTNLTNNWSPTKISIINSSNEIYSTKPANDIGAIESVPGLSSNDIGVIASVPGLSSNDIGVIGSVPGLTSNDIGVIASVPGFSSNDIGVTASVPGLSSEEKLYSEKIDKSTTLIEIKWSKFLTTTLFLFLSATSHQIFFFIGSQNRFHLLIT